MKFQPLQLGRRPEPFSHQDLFEIKYDGFRALAQIEHGRCKLVSRNGNEFKSFRTLCEYGCQDQAYFVQAAVSGQHNGYDFVVHGEDPVADVGLGRGVTMR